MLLPKPILDELSTNSNLLVLFQNQVNKDLERSGFSLIEDEQIEDFLLRLLEIIDTAVTENVEQLTQLFYLADVREKDVEEYGLVGGFAKREWDKVKFRYENGNK